METDRLVEEYLRRLETAAAHLQRSRRAELVAEIREHIETALRQEEAANEAAVRNVLERLGPPEEIVEAAEAPPAADPPAGFGKLEIAALILLVVPVVGWFVGFVLVFVSQAWSRRDKLVGVALALLPVLIPLVTLTAESGGMDEQVPVDAGSPGELPDAGSDSGLGPLEVVVLVFLFFAGWPGALYLGWRLRRHSNAGTA